MIFRTWLCPVCGVVDQESLAPHQCGFESCQGVWILSFEKAVQLKLTKLQWFYSGICLCQKKMASEVFHGQWNLESRLSTSNKDLFHQILLALLHEIACTLPLGYNIPIKGILGLKCNIFLVMPPFNLEFLPDFIVFRRWALLPLVVLLFLLWLCTSSSSVYHQQEKDINCLIYPYTLDKWLIWCDSVLVSPLNLLSSLYPHIN